MQRKVLSIQSHTVAGYVGNKSAIFPLQLLGFDVDPIHSVHFSNHTGYPVVRGQRLQGQDLLDIIEGLEANKLMGSYSHILTGYIGNADLLGALHQSVDRILKLNPDTMFVCDPVLGDNGKLYVPKELVNVYRTQLLPLATIITPNQFESELLADRKISNPTDAIEACNEMHKLGPKYIIITSLEDQESDCIHVIASECLDVGKYNQFHLSIRKIPGYYTGTGDLFSALVLGWTFHHPKQFILAVQKALGTMKQVLQRTCSEAGPSAELRLIQSRNDILNPRMLPQYQIIRSIVTGVIFDLDGTLTQPHSMCFDQIRTRYIIPFDTNLITALQNAEVEIRKEIHDAIVAEEQKALEKMVLQPQVVETIQALANDGIQLAIATRNTKAAVDRFFALSNISAELFQQIVTRDFKYIKPDPNVAISICETFKIHPSNVLFVGDLKDDVMCGNDAGCRSVLMLNDRNRELQSKATYTIERLSEISALIIG